MKPTSTDINFQWNFFKKKPEPRIPKRKEDYDDKIKRPSHTKDALSPKSMKVSNTAVC